MKVKELKQMLERFDEDDRVYLADWIEGYDTPGEVTSMAYEDDNYGFVHIKGIILDAAHCGNVED